jgi:hypothetical protein
VWIPLQAGELIVAAIIGQDLQRPVRKRALHGAQQRRQHLLHLLPRPLRVDDDAEHPLIPHTRG